MNNIKIRQRYVSDYNLPIQVLHSPYFEYYLDLYEPYNNSRTKWNELCNIIEVYYKGNGELFLEEYAKQRDNIITHIESLEEYKNFNKYDMNIYNILNEEFNKLSKSSVYIEPNNGKTFISIDLVKANFQALNFFDSAIVNFQNDYNSFIEYHLGINHPLLKYFQESKYSRQVIFGKLNMSRNVTIQKSLMSRIFECLNPLIKEFHNSTGWYSYNVDELIIEVINDIDKLEYILQQIHLLITNNFTGINFKVELYKIELVKFLTSANSTIPVYIKKGLKDKIMCCPNTYFSQVYKLLNNMEIEEKDLVFYYEHQLCKFLESLKVI